MFRGQARVKPRNRSLAGAAAVTLLVMIGSYSSHLLGYFLALSAMVMIVVAMHMESIWPTQAREENPWIFALFWGLMLGAIVPFLVTTWLDGGSAAILELFTTPP